MAAYTYSAINAEGLQLGGEVHAPDVEAAREQLRVRGLLAEYLEELPASGEESVRTVFKKIKPKTLQIFSRQFATMIEAGLNVVSSLVILEEQTDDPYFALVIRELRADVEGGLLLSQAMARHPKIFSRLYIAMVEAGEAAGNPRPGARPRRAPDREGDPDQAARQGRDDVPDDGADLRHPRPDRPADVPRAGLREHLRPAERRAADADAMGRGRVRPAAQPLVHHLPGDRPDGLGDPALQEDRAGRQLWDRIKLRIPMKIGDVVLKVTMARFSRTLSTLVAAGVDIIKALEITGQTAGNWVVEEALADVRQKVHQGVPIAQPLIDNPVFPPMVSQMVKIGEETGELEKMLGKIADFYEDEVDTAIASLTAIIEPLMMIGVGAMVGVIIISMYLPMFKLLSLVK
jgi:type IV pilus assembly protein PilC